MSRIGKKPIPIPNNVEVVLDEHAVRVKGPKGELAERLHPHVVVTVEEGNVSVSVSDPDQKHDRALWGLFRQLLANMVTGVTEGFKKELEISGVGFRAQVNGRTLVLNLGFSHPVEMSIPEGLTVTVEKNVITVSGSDKQRVGQFAAEIKSLRKPDPYKAKGIKYAGEVIRRKAGKVVKAVGAK
jgi:large subunit ribosomal protein L6